MGEVLKMCGVAVLCAFACMLLRQLKGELVPLLRIGGGLVLLIALVFYIGSTFSDLLEVLRMGGGTRYSSVLLKALGIAFVTKICADICKDCGEGTLSDGVGLGGKIAILSLCIPLINELIGYATEMLKLE